MKEFKTPPVQVEEPKKVPEFSIETFNKLTAEDDAKKNVKK